jgi:hypothetical protein
VRQEIERAEQVVVTRLLRLNAMINGVVAGVLLGLGMFLATNWLIIKGGPVVGPHLALLGRFFVGYRVTFSGSLIGLAYGFIVGFVVGYSVSWIYNRLLDLKSRGAGSSR